MTSNYSEFENKLLQICQDKEEAPFNKVLNISTVKNHRDWLSITKESKDDLVYSMTKILYKTFILACNWHPTLIDEDDEMYFAVSGCEDISDYLSETEVKDLFKLYNQTEYGGGFEEDATDILNRYYKILALCSSLSIDFSIKPLVIWIKYLKTLIDTGDDYYIYGTAYGGFYPIECLAKTLLALGASDLQSILSKDDIELIHQFMDKVLLGANNYNRDGRVIVNQVYELFGLGSTSYIRNNRAWTKKVVKYVESQDNQKQWEALLFYLSDVSDNILTKKRISTMTSLCEAIDSDKLDTFYTNIVDGIIQEIPIEYPFASSYNHNLICGLISLATSLKPENATKTTLKLAEFSLMKIPNYGISLPVLAKVCILSLGKFKDDFSIYALKKLRGDFPNYSIKLPIRIYDILDKAITHKKANQKLSTNAFNKIANQVHEKISRTTNKQKPVEFTDKQLLVELKRLGMDLGVIKKGDDSDDSDGYLMNGEMLETLYIWNPKPAKVWGLIQQFQNLKTVHLRYYKGKTIRNDIRMLPNLKELNLESQSLTSLSNKDFMMPALECLNVEGNEIVEIDANIKENLTLKTLVIGDNKFSNFPSAISQLKVLQHLNISNIKISKMGELPKSLNHLDLTACGLHEVGSKVLALENLERLILLENPISHLPLEIKKLRNLSLLNIESTQINPVPDFLVEMKNLKQVFIDVEQKYNKKLWKLVQRDYEDVLEDEHFIGEDFYLVPRS